MEDQIMFKRTYRAFEYSVQDDSMRLRALTKLLITKGVISPAEFEEQLKAAYEEDQQLESKIPACL
jgi:hypothetical protein